MRWRGCVALAMVTMAGAAASAAGAEEGPMLVAQVGRAMCGSYQPAVEAAINYGQQGVPISTAESVIESAYGIDARLWGFLRDSVRLAYQQPDALTAAMRDGRWVTLCEQALRR